SAARTRWVTRCLTRMRASLSCSTESSAATESSALRASAGARASCTRFVGGVAAGMFGGAPSDDAETSALVVRTPLTLLLRIPLAFASVIFHPGILPVYRDRRGGPQPMRPAVGVT